MKSITNKNSNSPNVQSQSSKLYTELFFEKGLDRSLLSGVKRITLREGKRHYPPNILVEGKPAKVERLTHTSLLHIDFETLVRNGHKSMFNTLMTMKRFYPSLTLNSTITVVEFRLIV
jgi:hypothetical protein